MYPDQQIKKRAPCLAATIQATARCTCGWKVIGPVQHQQLRNGGTGGDSSLHVTRQGRKHAARCEFGTMTIVTTQTRQY